MERCPHDLPIILCEACADAEVEKHKQLWKNEHMIPKFRLNSGKLEKYGAWVNADLAELQAEVVHATQTAEEATAYKAEVEQLLAEAQKALTPPADPPAPPNFGG